MTPEKIVQNSIISYMKSLAERGYPVYVERRQAGGFSYKMGIPDLYGIVNGRHIEIEVKRPGGERSSMQIKQQQKFESVGALYVCADSVDVMKQFMYYNFGIK